MFVGDTKNEMELESTDVVKRLIEIDSSPGEQEDVKIRKMLQVGRLISHSKNFSTSEFHSDIGIDLCESI